MREDDFFFNAFKEVQDRRKRRRTYTLEELQIINEIKSKTLQQNIDNISRTESYANFYERNKEIRWSFLASMVSRNAGWNMTDLEGAWFPQIIEKQKRNTLFLTYERANWLIFSDAYPQLLLYEKSKMNKKPLFYLLQSFSVSVFIEAEWEIFWEHQDFDRLVTSQIINEQNVIQNPVIDNPIYKRKVFNSFIYKIQDWLHFSAVLFPSIEGKLYGYSVYNFQKLDQRIELGKQLAALLFHKNYYDLFYQFSNKIVHTGSRYDYEKLLSIRKKRDTPYLRLTYPIVKHQRNKYTNDWFKGKRKTKWYNPIEKSHNYEITNWYLQKQKQLHLGITLEQIFKG